MDICFELGGVGGYRDWGTNTYGATVYDGGGNGGTYSASYGRNIAAGNAVANRGGGGGGGAAGAGGSGGSGVVILTYKYQADGIYPSATGGTVVTSGNYKIHTFTSSDTLTFEYGGNVEYLIVGVGGTLFISGIPMKVVGVLSAVS